MTIKRLALAAFLTVLSVLATSAQAQVVIGFPTIAFGPPGECVNAPLACEGPGYWPEPGLIDLYVYTMEGYDFEVRECAFGFVWPPEWQLLAVKVCRGTVIEGGISTSGDGVRMRFQPPIPANLAVLHLTFNAPTIGRIQFTRGPGGAYGFDLDGWRTYLGGDWNKFPFADVGDICGAVSVAYSCNLCRFIEGLYEPAASFTPPSLALTVEQGQTATAILEVDTSASCIVSGRCNQGWPFPDLCYDGLESRTSWLTLVPLSPGGPTDRFEVRANAAGLPPGVHLGSAEANPPDKDRGCCEAACFELELTVTPSTTSVPEPSVRETTWGRIKAVHD